MARIAFIGGGSYSWMPFLLGRLLSAPTRQQDRIVIMDIDAAAAETIHRLGLALKKRFESTVEIAWTGAVDEALEGADYVSLTIAVGGAAATKVDLAVPEKYGIFHTVGDTVGPGGFSRGLRNIPVVVDLARRMEKHCPDAWLFNLSNPLTPLTRAATRETKIKAVGLCQGVVDHVSYLVRLLGFGADADVQYVTAGIDHCPWLLELKIDGRDAIQMLRDRGLCSANVAEVAPGYDSHLGVQVGTRAVFAIWSEMGQLPGINDRHMVENFRHFITSRRELEKYGIERTSAEEFRRRRNQAQRRVQALIEDPGQWKLGYIHTQLIELIDALEGHAPVLTTLNTENIGQIPEFPLGANIETLCYIDRAGVHPLPIGRPLPRVIDAVVRPHILRQEGMIDAALSGDFDMAVHLLATDPVVGRITDARSMLGEMIQGTRRWLPRFASV